MSRSTPLDHHDGFAVHDEEPGHLEPDQFFRNEYGAFFDVEWVCRCKLYATVGRFVAILDEVIVLHDLGVDIILELSVQEPCVPIDLRIPLHCPRTANRKKVADIIPMPAMMFQEIMDAEIEVSLEPVGVKERVALTAAAAAARVDVPGWGWSEQNLCAWVVRHIMNFVQREILRHSVETHTNNNVGRAIFGCLEL